MHSTIESKATFSYSLREATEKDIPAMVDFFNELDEREPIEDGTTLGEFSDWFHNPMNRSVYRLACLSNPDGSEGKLIGGLDFANHPGDDKAWGWFAVHPDYRLAGVGRALYAEYERLSKESDAVTMNATSNSKANLLVEFLQRRGFDLDRYFWALRLAADQPIDEPTLPEGMTVRTFIPGQDEELWMRVRNATFADHYGSVPRTLEEIVHASKQDEFRPEGLFFAFDGDEVSGFCLTGIDRREEERLGYSVGHIHTLGTMPEYRRRGVGRGLLLVGVKYLREQGVSVVELGVEGKNEKALPLYEGVGFRQYRAWSNLVKTIERD